MSVTYERLRHILYRLKTKAFSESRWSVFVKGLVWRAPPPGTVRVAYRKDQDIRRHFRWPEVTDGEANAKLREFTERYAGEPDIVYDMEGDLVIEPDFGFAIDKGRRLIRESGTLAHPFLRPSLMRYLLHRIFSRKYTQCDTLIHCDGFAGVNLCHFIYDTLNPMLFLRGSGMLAADIPVLISEKVYVTPHFQHMLTQGFMRDIRWKVQGPNEWIKCRRLRKGFVSMEIFPETYALLNGPKTPSKRIFLNRKSRFQRNLNNIDVIRPIILKHGFEEVYAEDLSVAQQIALFRQVHVCVGLHGAGLTNLLYSEIGRLSVLEIFAGNYVHGSFFRFLKILKVGYYDAIVGTPLDINWGYSIDPAAFETKLEKLVESSHMMSPSIAGS